jgi:hypothetical protein
MQWHAFSIKEDVFSTLINGRCAQIPAIFENLIPRPEEKKDIFTDTPVFDD